MNAAAISSLAAIAVLLLAGGQANEQVIGQSADPGARAPSLVFRDITSAAGIAFKGPGSKEKPYILESMSGGVAVLDYDRDGWLDLFLVGSQTVATADRAGATSALYRNRGDGSFEDVTRSSGIAATGWGVGVCAGDVDGDGWLDLYVTGVEHNLLFRNLGGRGFRNITAAAGVAGGSWSTGCAFADFDRDGDLDLFVARYLDLRLDDLPPFGEGDICRYRDTPVQCGPRGLPGQSDLFFRNDGGRFTEVAKQVGVADQGRLFGLGVTWTDVDLDGWQDLFVANDTGPNFLYRNLGRGAFEEIGHLLGVAVSEDGKELGSMGVAVGDYLNEGWPSLFVTSFSEEYNALYRSRRGEYYVDASFPSATAAGSLPFVGWGTAFFDADNDGWLDLVLVNGHVYPQADHIGREASAPYRQRSMLYRNAGDGTFRPAAGDGPLAEPGVSRGLAVGDFDNDGRLDLVISDLDAEARVLRNLTEGGHYLLVELRGRSPRRDAIGAHLTLRAGTLTQTREVRGGGSYLSQNDLRQHFGLGAAKRAESLVVRWPDGSTSKHGPFAADRLVVVEQP